MNELGVVVSRYYENLKWIEQLKSPVDVYVYNRFGESPGMGVDSAAWEPVNTKKPDDDIGGLDIELVKNNGVNLQIIRMDDDPGYETSTYAYHFWQRHDQLNDVTVCLQAHPHIYIKKIIELLNDPHKLARTRFVGVNTHSSLIPPMIVNELEPIDFSFISDQFGWLDPYIDYGWKPQSADFTKAPWWPFMKGLPEWTDDPSKLQRIRPYTFGAGNQFMVNKKLVLKHDAEYYRQLQEFTKTYMDPNGSNRPKWQQLNQGPNLLEGSWKWVF